MIAVGQMLPACAVKGGTAMKLRFGVYGSRFSKDLDVARREELDKFLTGFDAALRDGWGGFTGEIRASTSMSRPPNVPADYIMVARRIKVDYMGLDLMSMDLEDDHQIAQKLHAVSGPGSLRAHDLVDLQLLEGSCVFDDAQVGALCARLFRLRKAHEWPPTIVVSEGWDELYRAGVGDLSVLPSVDEAVTWVNQYVARLNAARPRQVH
jgi:hypothetical protein